MSAGMALPAVSLSEAQAFVRIETGEEEALLAAMVRSASAICEAFLNQVLARDFTVDVAPSGSWTRLPLTPVKAITGVESIGSDGISSVLAGAAFATDIDAHGDGWVKLNATSDSSRVRVAGRAGLAKDCNGIPEPIRHGILRLTAHLFACRDEDGGEPPAAVTALWRPYRRMRLS